MEPSLIVIILGAALAGFIQGLLGFGFGLTAMAVWAWALEPRLAAVLAVAGALTGQLLAAFTVRRGFDALRLAPFLVGGLLGLPLGLALLPRLDVPLFRAVLGGLLVTWCPLMLLAPRLPRITRGGRIGDAASGIAGGVMGGLGGFTGAIPTLWCTLRGFDKDGQRAIIQNFNLAMLSVTFVAYLAKGFVTPAMLPSLAIVLPAMLLPALIGMRVYIGISEVAFRRIVLLLLTASGVALLAAAVPVLLNR